MTEFNLSEKRIGTMLNKGSLNFVYPEEDVKEFITLSTLVVMNISLTIQQKVNAINELAGDKFANR